MFDKAKIITEWFKAWYDSKRDRFENVFKKDAHYSKSWGQEYEGIKDIIIRFEKWHKHSKLIEWNIKGIIHLYKTIMVEWYFNCQNNKSTSEFDGCSIIEWSNENRIFCGKLSNYNPFLGA